MLRRGILLKCATPGGPGVAGVVGLIEGLVHGPDLPDLADQSGAGA